MAKIESFDFGIALRRAAAGKHIMRKQWALEGAIASVHAVKSDDGQVDRLELITLTDGHALGGDYIPDYCDMFADDWVEA